MLIRKHIRLLLLLMAMVVPLTLTGCAPGTPLGQQIAVDSDPQKALDLGRTKEDAINKMTFAPSYSETDKDKAKANLYTEAINYYGAVARRFPGTDTGVAAQIAAARINEDGLKNNTAALQAYRAAVREYPGSAEAKAGLAAIIAKMDTLNAQQPAYKVLDGLVHALGGNPNYSYVLSIVVISLTVTLALWPLRARQYRSSKEMMRFQPEIKRIQERYKDDKLLLNEKIQELYKKHGFNPLSGCLPLLFQMPVLWGLYWAISLYQFQFAKAHFLWVNPASAFAAAHWNFPAPFTFLNGALAANLGEQDLLLLLVYAISMHFQTKLQPVSDPAQAEQQKTMSVMMPAMFFIMMLQWHLPSAFVLYWFTSNVLSVGQQWWIGRTMPPPPPLNLSGEGDDDGGSGGDKPRPRAGSPVIVNGSGVKTLSPNRRLVSPKSRRRK